jgi:hypothetical protein
MTQIKLPLLFAVGFVNLTDVRWPKEDMHLKKRISINFFLQNFHRCGNYFPPRWEIIGKKLI